jgi:MSHA biogenesis protein MshP
MTAGRLQPRFAQRGFAAIASVFVLVVLAALGAFMMTFSNTQQLTSAQDVQGSRAYWAARAGLEWAATLTKSGGACPAASTTFDVDSGATFALTVTCSMLSYSEGPATVNVFSLNAVARQGTVGSPGYVERSVSAALEN